MMHRKGTLIKVDTGLFPPNTFAQKSKISVSGFNYRVETFTDEQVENWPYEAGGYNDKSSWVGVSGQSADEFWAKLDAAEEEDIHNARHFMPVKDCEFCKRDWPKDFE